MRAAQQWQTEIEIVQYLLIKVHERGYQSHEQYVRDLTVFLENNFILMSVSTAYGREAKV